MDGYLTETPYPDYFHPEMMPVWLNSALQALGYQHPDLSRAYTWCELGCGTGISTIVAAASNPNGRFIGVDINADAIQQARSLAERIGLHNVQFMASSFEQLAQGDSESLPACDYIVCHGVYSWVSHANRLWIQQIVRQHLKPAGVAYLAYMSQPLSLIHI